MKKYIAIISLLLCSFAGLSQTTQTRVGFFPNGEMGMEVTDTVYLLTNVPNNYYNAFGNFVSFNTDSIAEGSTNLWFTTARARAAFTGTTNRITITSGAIDISGSYVGQSSITTLGTIGAGTWQGTPVATPYGGVPPGGSIGYVLTKNSGSDYDVIWAQPDTSGGGGGGGGVTEVKQVHAAGATVTVNNTTTWLISKPALAALTITMPSAPYDFQLVLISFKAGVTSLVVSPNTGHTISDVGVLGEVLAGESISYKFDITDGIWYRQ